MHIRIYEILDRHLGEVKMRKLGHESRGGNYGREYVTIDLTRVSQALLDTLVTWVEAAVTKEVIGAKTVLQDINTWKRVLTGKGKAAKPRTLQQWCDLLTGYIGETPGHRFYKRLDDEGKAHTCYYVNYVEFHPETRSHGDYQPAYVEVHMLYNDMGNRNETHEHLHMEDVQGTTAPEGWAKRGYFPETDELRAAYLDETDRFTAMYPRIGTQCLAEGFGTDDIDDLAKGNGRASRWSVGKDIIPMEVGGARSKVVIDVFQESDKEDRRRREGIIRSGFWHSAKPLIHKDASDLEWDEERHGHSELMPDDSIEIPVHPFCAVFDLRRHARLKVHINYLEEYVYNSELGASLILPDINKQLVNTLINQSKADFKDIIAGKGMGVCVLLAGPPGVGKTLTAEVFSETAQRPLYSIQAAQLGTKSDQVEGNLTLFLQRGSRWNAVTLLDEADVYIRNRDRNMDHNAIVAAFLRVLEYQSSVLFLTTNRGDTVDDAIASRCIARIDFEMPDMEQQADIWAVLSTLNGNALDLDFIEAVVGNHPNLSGRDIKQLLKLAWMVQEADGGEVTPKVIDFVSQFRPVGSSDMDISEHVADPDEL